ncbi:winged helix family transcriptional regulator [Rhodothermaceae bacterium RA]|nr:winged helix family transcriptional regulator [Rhodothermaceae bacterium RA]
MPRTPFTICLVTDSRPIRDAVELSCPPPHRVRTLGLQGVLEPDHSLSEQGEALLEAAAEADVVLVSWSLEQAPLIGTLCHLVRQATRRPILALCGGSQDEVIAALTTGVDEVVHFPLYLPVLQARVAALERHDDVIHREAARTLKASLRHTLGAEPENTDGHAPPDARPAASSEPSDALQQLAAAVQDSIDEVLIPVDRTEDVLTVGPLRLEQHTFRFFIHDDEVELTPKEFDVLQDLMRHRGEVRTRDEILEAAWGIDFDTGTNTVDVYMHFLRKKLKAHGVGGMLETVRGRGFRLVEPDAG